MKIMKLVMVVMASMYLFGCASGAQVNGMVYSGESKYYADPLKKNLALSPVAGGRETNPLWTSEISSDAFHGALKQSLSDQGLLSDTGKYKLDVMMLNVEQPMFGLDFTVKTHIKYVLKDTSTGSVVLNETLVAAHTATFDDAFAGVKRLRLANEGSGKNNIAALLQRLSELKIQSNEVSIVK